MDAALRAPMLAGATVGATCCPEAGVTAARVTAKSKCRCTCMSISSSWLVQTLLRDKPVQLQFQNTREGLTIGNNGIEIVPEPGNPGTESGSRKTAVRTWDEIVGSLPIDNLLCSVC